ncbi:hypothetical protein [Oligoflexus tunisiensis]|uniref:hypothetical protein n=1 Tax=Oligoflexus tunisiensis TaxID=708132 RepID=UPI00114CD435|nr:hypothetical protein [Oligoflexus tunisiensis]
MKSLCLFLALTAWGAVQARPIESPLPPTCKDHPSEPAACAILELGAPAVAVGPLQLAFRDVQDSRCPLNVVCVWAGFVTTTIALDSEDGSVPAQKIQLSLDPRYPETDVWMDEASGLMVQLVDVSRTKAGPQPIGLKRYAKVLVGYDLKIDR